MTNRLLSLRPSDCSIHHLPLAAIASHTPGFLGRNVRADTTDPNGRGPVDIIVVGGGPTGTPKVYIRPTTGEHEGDQWLVYKSETGNGGSMHPTIGEALAAACAIGPDRAEQRREVLKTMRHAYIGGSGWQGSSSDVGHLWGVLTELWVSFTPQAGSKDHQALDRACDGILD